MDRGAWWAAVHGDTKCRTRLSDFTFTFHFHALEKEMATHSRVLAWRILGTVEPGLGRSKIDRSSTLAWKIPWTEEPDRLQSMGLLRVGHD